MTIILLFGVVVLRGAPYVPSKKRDVKQAFSGLYKLGSKDVLVDIGSGDGVVLRVASEFGAKAVGYEINPLLVIVSRLLSLRDRRVLVKWGDYWLAKLPNNTTIVYTFGESKHIKKMAEYVEAEASRMGKTLYFMSYGFEVPGRKIFRRSGVHILYRFTKS